MRRICFAVTLRRVFWAYVRGRISRERYLRSLEKLSAFYRVDIEEPSPDRLLREALSPAEQLLSSR